MKVFHAEDLPAEEASGIAPRVWICVGSGYSREDVKSVLLRSGRGFVADAITTVSELCARIVGVSEDRILGASSGAALSRQEILRYLLSQRAIAAYFPELKRLRRQRSFYSTLDRTLQSARMTFAHHEEGRVLSEFLETRIGANPVRRELEGFAVAYENWMENGGWWDPPLLIRKATERLENGWPTGVPRPEEIRIVSGVAEESLERNFWEALSRLVTVRRHDPANDNAAKEINWKWERWHTPDDAADGLANDLATMSPDEWARTTVLFPDLPDVRRSLLRAFSSRGLPLADPRDPARLRKEEVIKLALLPLELVARGFRRPDVLSYFGSLSAFSGDDAKFAQWSTEIALKGIRKGLKCYSGEKLGELRILLETLERRFGGKASCVEIANAHLSWISELLSSSTELATELAWIQPFFEAQWTSLSADLERVGFQKRAPLAYWSQKIASRVYDGTPPVDRAKPERGIRMFRLQQFPLESRSTPVRLRVFGLPPQWLSEASFGDYWFSAREREVLAVEFPVRSGAQIKKERLEALQAWLGCAESVQISDFMYSFDGRERESLKSVLAELKAPANILSAPEERGCHAKWLPSYGVVRPLAPLEVKLPPIAAGTSGVPEISATTLDRMSRCAFQAMALQRWRLWDDKEPDSELWPEVKGNILHHAVKLLLRSRDEEGRFMLSCQEALESAWREKAPKGLFRSPRVESYVRSRLIVVLEKFCEQEIEFWLRARTKTVSLEDVKLRLDYPSFAIIGEPDRVEEHADGMFVSDYKTSSALPNGTLMLELGYRLQLPFYALAAERHYGKPVIGIQFIQLTRDGGRGSGIFFSRWNGKETGKLTKARSNSKSLFSGNPGEIWARLEEQIVQHAADYVNGNFKANPKKGIDECKTCQAADLCGFRRRGQENEGESDV